MTLIAAADGSALGNPGAAGWAWYIDEHRWRSGGWKHATNNQAELMAVLSLLRETREVTDPLHVLCDSQYVINALTQWLPGWKRRGWRKADGKAVLNRDLLEQLDVELRGRKVSFEWVKGHSGHQLNEKVDDLAKRAAMAFQRGGLPAEGPGFGTSVANAPSADSSLPTETPALFDLTDETAGATPSTQAVLPSVRDALLQGERILRTIPVPDKASELVTPDSMMIRSDGTFTHGSLPADADEQHESANTRIEILHLAQLAADTVLIVFRTETASVCTSVWQERKSQWKRILHQESR